MCILCATRPEWTYVDFAISSTGAVVVPIYPTNSPEECEWVAGNSESRGGRLRGRRAGGQDLRGPRQASTPSQRRGHRPVGRRRRCRSLDDLRARGRGRDAAELRARYEAVDPDDPFTFIYTSGTTGPPKGCVLTHGNYRSVLDMCESIDVLAEGEDVYLFLPLAHAFALLIQLLTFDLGGYVAYWGKDAAEDHPRADGDQADVLPVGPAHLREALHARHDEHPQELPRERSRRWSPWA